MTKAYDCALRLLARREHGMRELINKLTSKGYPLHESKSAVLKCQELDLQSDNRFVESLCNARLRQGYGPVRIMQELQAKYIDKELISQFLETKQEEWEEYASLVWQKKFKGLNTSLISDLQKQIRFLLYRGFPADVAVRIVNNANKK